MTQSNLLKTDLPDLDPEIRQLAEREALGELRKVYRTSKRSTPIFVMSIVLLVWGIVWTFFAALFLLISPLHPSPMIALVFTLPGLLLLIVGFCMILPRKIYARWHVSLWQAGFLYEKGSLRQVFRWDQIESIQGQTAYDPQRGLSFFSYRVRRLDGYEVKLNAVFPDVAELIDCILEEYTRQMAPRELRLIPPRERMFASFKLDRQGISDQQDAFSWQEMEEMTIEHATVTILKKGK